MRERPDGSQTQSETADRVHSSRDTPQRAASATSRVTLREITEDTVIDVVRLKVAQDQERFVAPNAVSLAQALFSRTAWYRAIYLDDAPVGFVMLSDDSLSPSPPADPEIWIWRFMVDERYQGQGIGAAALRLVIDHVRRKGGFKSLQLSFVPGDGGPEGLYLAAGFKHTGRVEEDEVVLELPLVS